MTNDSESAIQRMMKAGMTRAEAEHVIASLPGGSEAFKLPPIDPEAAADRLAAKVVRLAAKAARAAAELAEATGRYTKSINELTELAKETESISILRARTNHERDLARWIAKLDGAGLLSDEPLRRAAQIVLAALRMCYGCGDFGILDAAYESLQAAMA